MSIAEKFEVIADEVYEKGKEYIWEVVQQGGARTDYREAFVMWDMDYIHPKYKVTPIADYSGYLTFSNSKIKKIEKEYFDFSQKISTSNIQSGWYYTFSGCNYLEEVEDIGMQAMINYSYTFAWCYNLHTIAIIRTDENTSWGSTFTACSNLQNITIEGVIGKSGFSVKDCKRLTKESLLSILRALSKDSTVASGKSITFAAAHQEVIESDAECLEQLNLAVNAGWTIAYA